MTEIPAALLAQLQAHGQDHVLTGWEQLSPAQQTALVEQLASIDLEALTHLYARRDTPESAVPLHHVTPLPTTEHDLPSDAAERGVETIRAGRLAALVVAGGQGTRLGFEHPKGMYPVGPVSGKSLFQIHAEKVLALRRRYEAAIPLLVMTSPVTHAETVDFFGRHRHFGLPPDDVWFFQQGTMPALDLATGRLLLELPGTLALSPDGHGGTLTALASQGLLSRLRDRGVEHLFYFQVDNPLVRVGDPLFLGRHVAARAEVSSKVIPKLTPDERMGALVQLDGRCAIVEYSDLTPEQKRWTAPDGRLLFGAGNPAIHLFSLTFLERITSQADGLPIHLARKKMPHYDTAAGKMVVPTTENALKFERFIFDALPLADRWLTMEARREDEFAPLKNATGPDSPETVRAAMVDQGVRWLAAAGIDWPRAIEGQPQEPVEIGPLFALDVEELRAKRELVLAALARPLQLG